MASDDRRAMDGTRAEEETLFYFSELWRRFYFILGRAEWDVAMRAELALAGGAEHWVQPHVLLRGSK